MFQDLWSSGASLSSILCVQLGIPHSHGLKAVASRRRRGKLQVVLPNFQGLDDVRRDISQRLDVVDSVSHSWCVLDGEGRLLLRLLHRPLPTAGLLSAADVPRQNVDAVNGSHGGGSRRLRSSHTLNAQCQVWLWVQHEGKITFFFKNSFER